MLIRKACRLLVGILIPLLAPSVVWGQAPPLGWIGVSPDGKGFVDTSTSQKFEPFGFNYDHDEHGRLLEDYWEREWEKVESDFQEMAGLKGRVVRVHLQFGKFMRDARSMNEEALQRLKRLTELAHRNRLYLNLTGLACYHKADVPDWYDRLSEDDRWNSQAIFWRGIASELKDEPAIFCYDLMNEPVVSGGKRPEGDWLGPPFAGKHFVQFICLDPKERKRSEVAKAWIRQLRSAIRTVDARHLITVGMVDWSLDRPGLTSGLDPRQVGTELDFISVHLYPESKKMEEAIQTLNGFQVGRPIVIEETFPLRCSIEELTSFRESMGDNVAGWISFYWGQDLGELRASKEIKDAILLQWLERFRP